jgi:hypothetical protein
MAGRLEDAPGRAAVVYRRRRSAVVLASLSVLIGLSWAVAWAVGGLNQHSGRSSRAAVASSRGGPVGHAAARTGSTRLGVPGATSARKAAPVAVRPCPMADISLSLSTLRASYSVQQLPYFDVDVVSSAGYTCTFDVGAGRVLLRISAGRTRIWTSADCAEGLAVRLATLHHGVPTVVSMTWDEQYSSAGCPVPGRIASAGSYTASATVGSAASNGVTFRIG